MRARTRNCKSDHLDKPWELLIELVDVATYKITNARAHKENILEILVTPVYSQFKDSYS